MTRHSSRAARDVRQRSAVRDRSSGVGGAMPHASHQHLQYHSSEYADDIPATCWIHGSGTAEGDSTRSPNVKIASEGALLDPVELALIEAT